MYDLIIVGAGPAGIFTALELLRKSSTPHKILLVEKGKPVEKRHCPKDKTGVCVNCKPTCAITTGFSGAGAFSDGKLSLSYQVGGELPDLIGEDFAQELIDYTDKIYLEFGADPKVEGIYEGPDIKDIRKRAIQAGLQLVDCPIRHLGTEKAQQLYLNIKNKLADAGEEIQNGFLFAGAGGPAARAAAGAGGTASATSTPSRSLLPRAAAVRTGWKRSAPSTTLPTSPAPLTSASVLSAATRSWRRSTRSCMRAS